MVAKRRPASLVMAMMVLGVFAGPARSAVDVGSSGSAGATAARVPCSSLPELRHMALKVAILGECRSASGGWQLGFGQSCIA